VEKPGYILEADAEERGLRAESDEDKAKLFADHLATPVFATYPLNRLQHFPRA
jgi:hypothetical protein